ncbi:transporter substrate-binding domain-containing protein [Mesorhizobium sp. LNHC252B00]|uniref:transporter substrate-binding domain-containing protein n=1 Tax=Mesorhizobium sp. LNHC252B00 TaxID=1287252 RepID=UPI0018DB1EF6|nr:transporter substrate-binding domain-containing protein [Mesorhizobium sp. LNHC252B00]
MAWRAPIVLSLFFALPGAPSALADGRVDAIHEYGTLRCGVIENIPEMSEDINGTYVGYDVEFCKDLAKRLGVAPQIVPIATGDEYRALRFDQKVDLVIGHSKPDEAKAKRVTISIPYFGFDDNDVRVIISPVSDTSLEKLINSFVWDQIITGRQAKLHNDFTGEKAPNLKDRTCGYNACPWLTQ